MYPKFYTITIISKGKASKALPFELLRFGRNRKSHEPITVLGDFGYLRCCRIFVDLHQAGRDTPWQEND